MQQQLDDQKRMPALESVSSDGKVNIVKFDAIEGTTYKNELDLLAAQTGRDGRTYGQLYQYTIGMDFQDYLDQTRQSTRIAGAVQAIGGGVGIVGGAGMCTTGMQISPLMD